jgi:predicted ATPase
MAMRGARRLADDVAGDEPSLTPHVRDALTHLYDPTYLQTHPLTQLMPREPNNHAVRLGKALQGYLLAAIEELRPSDEIAESHAWRSYQLLRLRYVEALEIPAIARQLAVSQSECFRDLRRAVQAIAGIVGERWGLVGGVAVRGERPLAVPGPSPDAPRPWFAPPPTNLPTSLTRLVGRDQDMADLKSLIGPTRLLTLSGAGGVGKTRLAVELGRDLLPSYPDGVWMVDLAPLTDPSLVPRAVATALGLPEQPGRSLAETLRRHLTTRRTLLVLDNCEHLIDACANLAQNLLENCPALHVLTTTREPLRCAGEVVWRTPSLPAPDPAFLPSGGEDLLSTVELADATRLFAERARAVQPGFAVNVANARCVAEICRRLDGIPLALELAAARTTVLSVDQIARGLDDRFALLTHGRRTALPRQRTLRATIDWSYDLLTVPEQALFRRLSVFAGGWTLEAAEAVCAGWAADEDQASEVELRSLASSQPPCPVPAQSAGSAVAMLDPLARLVDKSLVLVETTGAEARYHLLETIRQYGWERLSVAGELEFARRRHRAWCVELAERLAPDRWAGDEPGAVRRVESEQDNLRAALHYCLTDDVQAGLRLASGVWMHWWRQGAFAEAYRWLEALLARAPERTLPRARALLGAGMLARDIGDRPHARSRWEEGLSICREVGDIWGMTWVTTSLGTLPEFDDGLAGARDWYQEGLKLARDAGDKPGCARALQNLGGKALNQGDFEKAKPLLEESLRLWREAGRLWGAISCSVYLGTLLRFQGDYARARALLEENLTIVRETGYRGRYGALAIEALGNLCRSVGDYPRAWALLTESLARSREVGSPHDVSRSLCFLGMLAVQQDSPVRGARLLAAAEKVCGREPGSPYGCLEAGEPAECAASVAAAKAALGDEAFDAAWAEGLAMTPDQGVSCALERGSG